MKKIIFTMFLLVAMVVTMGAGCGNYYSQTPTPTTPTVGQQIVNEPTVNQPATNESVPTANQPTTTYPPVTEQPTSVPANRNVTIQDFAFEPVTLTIKVGDTITWTNQDSAPHDVKFDAFTSPKMAKGKSFSYKFDTAGTFGYICGIHPSMKGQIIVK